MSNESLRGINLPDVQQVSKWVFISCSNKQLLQISELVFNPIIYLKQITERAACVCVFPV